MQKKKNSIELHYIQFRMVNSRKQSNSSSIRCDRKIKLVCPSLTRKKGVPFQPNMDSWGIATGEFQAS